MSRSLTPQNPLTTNTISVSSSAGFGAGDLVYQKSGDFGVIPNNTVTSANFNIPATVPSGSVGPSTATLLSTNGNAGGGAGSAFPNAARLTNGNMVVVYCALQNSNYYFRIIDENGAEVVAETQALGVTSVNAIYAQVCVTALTGGGFAMAAAQSSGFLTYAIYSNTGTVVTAPITDSTVSLSTAGSFMNIQSRPDGSFIILMNDNTSANTRFKVYSATGVQVIAWTNVVAYYTYQGRCSVAVRSDNSFVISTWTSSTNIQYYVYSAAGSTSTNASVSSGSTPQATYTRLDSTTLTNDSVVVDYNEDSTNNSYYRILTAANSLGSIVSAGSTSYASGVDSLASGGFIYFMSNTSDSRVFYSVRNSAGTQTASGTYFGVCPVATQRGSNYSVVEMASNIAVVGSWMFAASSGNSNPGFQTMFQIVTATSAIRNFSTTSLVTGAASSPVSVYARSGSTPNAAAFLASSNNTINKSILQLSSSIPSYVLASTVVDSIGCNNVFVRVMQNGQIVVVYTTTGSTNLAKMAVYSPSGVYITTYTIAASKTNSIIKCCVLTNGNLVVSYADNSSAANVLTFAIYSPAFVLLSTATVSSVSLNASQGHDISPMTNARFAFAYTSSGSGVPTHGVYNSSGVVVTTGTISTAYDRFLSIAGMANGGYVICAGSNSLSTQVTWFSGSGAQIATNNFGPSNTSAGNAQSCSVSPNGTVMTYTVPNSSGGYAYVATPGASWNSSLPTSTTNATQVYASTVMPDGTFVGVMLDNSTYYGWMQATPGVLGPTGSNNVFKSSALSFAGGTQPYSASSDPGVQMAALFDNQFVVAYRDTSTYPRIFIGSTTAGTYSLTTVTGTTVSNPAYFPSPSNGYILKGVATTTATAGGSGIVQNVGATQLNSQYPSGTSYQAFDSTGTLIQGTKGTITGRNVNMTGTS